MFFFQVSSDDELILAVDSPLLQNNNSKPRIKITDASKDSRFPTEVSKMTLSFHKFCLVFRNYFDVY